jgi:hypothetical protein
MCLFFCSTPVDANSPRAKPRRSPLVLVSRLRVLIRACFLFGETQKADTRICGERRQDGIRICLEVQTILSQDTQRLAVRRKSLHIYSNKERSIDLCPTGSATAIHEQPSVRVVCRGEAITYCNLSSIHRSFTSGQQVPPTLCHRHLRHMTERRNKGRKK